MASTCTESGGVAGPVKRSVMIAGHATSISLEPIFWAGLARAAEDEGLPLNALIARIDAARVAAPDPPNLASAVRVWLYRRATETITILNNVDTANDSQ